jgi:hypothetical protein
MGHVAGTTFGIGAPTTFPVQASPWGISPYASQSLVQPFSQQQQLVPQIVQLLQSVPQQLQQLQALQQYQNLQIQQLLQLVPAQLQQLQQLIQFIPQQGQYPQHLSFGSAVPGPVGFGIAPQGFAGQGASYVM